MTVKNLSLSNYKPVTNEVNKKENHILKKLLFAMTGLIVSVLIVSACFAQPCTYALTPPNQAIGSAGTIGGPSQNVTVVTAGGCQWMAVSNDSWIRIVFGNNETEGNPITYAVLANPGPNARRGAMTIAGLTFIVSQASPVPAPCTITVPDGETVSYKHWLGRRFSITASTPTCAWTIQSMVPWIHIRTISPGHGSILAVYDIDENPGATRAGRILVNGKHFTVTQLHQ